MPESQNNERVKFADDEQAKEGLITAWLAGHPCPTWENVRNLLRNGIGGEEGERAADEVEETYINSESDCIILFVNNNINKEYLLSMSLEMTNTELTMFQLTSLTVMY